MSTTLPRSFAIFRAQADHAIEHFVTSIALQNGRLVAATFSGGYLASEAYGEAIYGRVTNDNQEVRS